MPFKDKEKLKEWRRKWWSSLTPERKKKNKKRQTIDLKSKTVSC